MSPCLDLIKALAIGDIQLILPLVVFISSTPTIEIVSVWLFESEKVTVAPKKICVSSSLGIVGSIISAISSRLVR